MRIDIIEIAGKNGAYIIISEEIATETLCSEIIGIELDKNVHADLKIEYMEGIIMVKGKIRGGYKSICGRCLKDISRKFDIDINEGIIHIDEGMEDSDGYLYEGNQLDLTVLLIDKIMLSFPGAMLCREECKGLCDVCGIDLNLKSCSCEKDKINIKMEKLKDFFNQ